MLQSITLFEGATFVGMRSETNLANNKTSRIWSEFMPMANFISQRTDKNYVSVEIYPEGYFKKFDPQREFTKWAAVKVNRVHDLPEKMEVLEIPAGEYAVFKYVGKASEAPRFYQYIFGEWLPESNYELDHRPHFAVMGPNYRPDDPKAEESIWVPVKRADS